MSEETRKVLEMLSNGKVSVQEAEQLLQAVTAPSQSADEKKVEPRYFRILVNKPAREGKKAEAVNIRVPMTVVRGGLRLGSLFPGMLAKKKVHLANGNEHRCGLAPCAAGGVRRRRANWPTAASSTCRR
jgi:hypothetical protein